MKLKADFTTSFKQDGFCNKGMSYWKCQHNYQCWRCDIADSLVRTRLEEPKYIDCVDESGVLQKNTPENQLFYKKVVVVNPEVLDRLSKKREMYYQLFYCEDGPGCLSTNPTGAIDGYFLSDLNESITLLRLDILGIPTRRVCETYDNYYFTNTLKVLGYTKRENKSSKGGGSYDCIKIL